MKRKVLFVGSFVEQAKDGSVGGQMFACRSLLASALRDEFEFILLDTTSESVPAPGFVKRLINAIRRLWVFMYLMVSRHPHAVLIFSSAGFSFIEKGLMIILAKPFRCKSILAPRSGILLDNIRSSNLFKGYAKSVLRSADHIIAQGSYWKDFFSGLLKESNHEKIVVIPNWIDVSKYQPCLNKSKAGHIQILYMGWIETYKGIYDIVEAAGKLKMRMTDFTLHIYGRGSQAKQIENVIASKNLEGYITMHGWAIGEEKKNILCAADVFVLPSHREGFPNVLLEAMSAGIPVIAADIGVIPEIITPGINGELFKAGSPVDLSEKMYSLCTDGEKRKIYRANGIRLVSESYSIRFAEVAFRKLLS